MLRAATRNVLGHKLRLMLTAISIILGVAFVSGTFILTDSMQKTFYAIADNQKVIDVYVHGVKDDSVIPDANGEKRRTVPLSDATKIQAVAGVQSVEPDVTGQAILIGKDGTAAVNGGAPGLGFGWSGNPKAWTLLSGRVPSGATEVAVEKNTLKLADLKVGDSTRAVVGGQVLPVTIVGSVEAPGGIGLAGATATLFDIPSAEKYYAEDGNVTGFQIYGDSGVSRTDLRQRVSAAVPGTEVLTGDQYAAQTKSTISTGVLKIFKTFFLVFAGVAVFVGAFVILNTFSMLVAQRTRELALLRALGASRRQVTRSVLVEAFIVGTFSSLIGLGLGAVIAIGLKAMFNAFGLQIGGSLPIEPRTVIACFAVGILVTLVAAYFPARRAARIPPVAAMRDDIALPARGLRRRTIVGLLLLVGGVAILCIGLFGSVSNAGVLTGLGAGLLVIGVTVLAPIIAPPVLRVITTPFGRLWGTSGRLARDNAIRNPRRTAATASALMVGLALVVGITVIASSGEKSFSSALRGDLKASYIFATAGGGTLPASSADAARKVPGVKAVAEYTAVPVIVGGDDYDATVSQASDLVAAQRVDMKSGSVSVLDSNQILVSSKAAKANGWHMGQVLTGRFQGGSIPMTIGGVYTNDQLIPTMVIPRAWYEKVVPASDRTDFAIAVVTASGSESASVRQGLVDAVKPYAVISVKTKDEFLDDQQAQLNIVLYILYALLGLAVLIAVFGIINTLALSVFERTREIGLLRAVGMGRKQLRRVIRLESVAISVFGALMGIVLGLFFGIAVQQALKNDGIDVLSIPYVRLVIFLVLAALAGVFAAIWPARRAAKLDVLRAITTE
jgi:putative ABC transport system permease protein